MNFKVLLRILITFIYLVIVISQHENFGAFLAKNLDVPLGRQNYNLLSIVLTFVSLGAVFFILYTKLKEQSIEFRKVMITYLLLTFLILFLVWKTLFVLNVEFIHVFQYALLAFLLYPMIRDFSAVLFLTTLIGGFDEFYQYIVLTPTNHYYDLNDVVINFFGAVLGSISYVIIYGKKLLLPSRNILFFIKSLFIVLTSVLIVGLLSRYIELGPEVSTQNVFVFFRNPQPSFWHSVPPNIHFHVLHPIEFIVYMLILFVLYHKLGTTIKCKH